MAGMSILGGLFKGASGAMAQKQSLDTAAKIEKSREALEKVKAGADEAGGIDLDKELSRITKRAVPSRDSSQTSGTAKRGGRIKKTGSYRLHEGEIVVPSRIAKRIGKSRQSSRR